MILGYGADAVRAAEQPLLAVGEPLMLRAARGLADRIRTHLADADPAGPSGPAVLVLAGSGANGGDGLHAAAILRREGLDVEVIATADTLHAEGEAALNGSGGTAGRLADLDESRILELVHSAPLVVDAMLGIGGRPQIPASLTALLQAVRERGGPVIAADVPSFLDATTGEVADGALAAVETVTFGAVKAGLLLPGGADLAGAVHLVDLGLGPGLATQRPEVVRLTDSDAQDLWPRPERDATKYSRGVVTVVAGSSAFPGAAVLATSGAARSGAGMVRCVAPAPVLDLVLRSRPEVVGHRAPDARTPAGPAEAQVPADPAEAQPSAGPAEARGPAAEDRPVIDLEQIGCTHALVVGPGMPPEDPRARAGMELLLRGTGELERGVIDAGGLDTLTAADRFGPQVILTPHGGEAARLARRLDIDPGQPVAELASALAARTGATVLHKGAVTVIAPGDGGPLRTQDDATPQLATAGTGDVLAGVLGALLAAGLSGPDAAALGALLHGRAGARASRDGLIPLVAQDVADHLPVALADILAVATP